MIGKKQKVFTKEQVVSAMSRIKTENEGAVAAEKDKIFALLEENAELKQQNAALLRRDKLISDALVAAVEKAKEIESAAKRKCDLEIKRLRLFQAKWQQYFARVMEQYPVDENLQKMQEFTQKVGEILGSESGRPLDATVQTQNVSSVFADFRKETAVASATPFDPKAKIDAYMKSESGFDMEEVLNPKGELNLEALCRELGLMD